MSLCFYYWNRSSDIGHAELLLRVFRGLSYSYKKNEIFLAYSSPYESLLPELRKYSTVLRLDPSEKAGNPRRVLSFLKNRDIRLLATEFFPMGRLEAAREILPVVSALKEKGAKILSLNPLPYFVHPGSKTGELLSAAALYDKILIHAPSRDLEYFSKSVVREKRISRAGFLRVFSVLKKKIDFTGYVLPEKVPAAGGEEKGAVVVQRGGGSVLPEIIDGAIEAKKTLPAGLKMLIVAGVATPEKDLRKWKKRIVAAGLKKIKVLRSVKDLPGLLAKASVTVGTAGAAAYEVLFFSGKAVFIPYEGSPGREHSDQTARAALMKDLLGSGVIRPGELNGERLAAAIENKMREKTKKAPNKKPFFDGLKKTVDCLKKFHDGGI